MKYKSHTEGEVIQKKDYSKKIIFPLADFQVKGHLLQTVTIPPQTKQRLHKHFQQYEVNYILDGECAVIINGKEFFGKPGDSFITEPGDTHQLWNKSHKEFTLVVFKINYPQEGDDTEWIEE